MRRDLMEMLAVLSVAAVLTAAKGTPADSPLLVLDQPTSGTLGPGDTVEAPPKLKARFGDARVRGKRYRLRVPADGSGHVELRSYLFDAYLVLRAEDGRVLAEDDSSLPYGHALLGMDGEPAGALFLVDACALGEGAGEFELVFRSGPAPPLELAEQRTMAVEDARKRIAVLQDRRGEAHPDTTLWQVRLADLLQARGDFEEAARVLERVLAVREKTLGAEHIDTLQAMNNLGVVLLQIGDVERARTLHQRVLETSQRTLGADHSLIAVSLGNLGMVAEAQGRFADARDFFERALELRRRFLGEEHGETLKLTTNLAATLDALGEYAAATRLHLQALKVGERVLAADDADLIAIVGNLANSLQLQGRYEEARPLLERALAMSVEVLGPNHPQTGIRINNLASLLNDQGNALEAIPFYERALEIQERTLGPDHRWTLVCANNLANALHGTGRFDAAEEIYRRVLRSAERISDLEAAPALANLAALMLSEEKYGEARGFAERAHAIFAKQLGDGHPFTSLSQSTLAMALQGQGALADARALLDQVCETWRVLDPEHPRLVSTLNDLAVLLGDMGDLGAAWKTVGEALALTETQLDRVLWSLSESERLSYAASMRVGLEIELSLADRIGTESAQRGAYEQLLLWKGRVSRSLLATRERATRTMDGRTREILQALEHVQTQLVDAIYATRPRAGVAGAPRLADLRQQRGALERELGQRLGKPAEVEPATIAGVKASLPADAAIVDFFIHRPAFAADRNARFPRVRAPARVTAWVIGGGGDRDFRRIDLGSAAEIDAALQAFLIVTRRQLSAPAENEAERALIRASNDRLRRLIWDPIASLAQGKRLIVLSPDQSLGSLPFETLALDDQSYLIEHHAFVYLQDLAALPAMSRSHAAPSELPSLLVVGDVDYQQRDELADAAGPRSGATMRGTFRRRWEPLPGTQREMAEVAELHEREVGEDVGRLVLRGSAATEERVRLELPRYDCIHFATHAYFRPEGLLSLWDRASRASSAELEVETERVTGLMPGLLSGLVFSGANEPLVEGRENGLLTAEEITWTDLSRCDLVVLSACETGIGTPASGEGLIGLRRSFRQAGARTVVSSLWPVGDAATAPLMCAFYQHLWADGLGKLGALRAAQLGLLSANRREHGAGLPGTWGAFVLDGDWR